MPMPQEYAQADTGRRLLVSWRPPTRGGNYVKDWVAQLLEQLAAQCADLTVVDSLASGEEKAVLRERWTDFLAVYNSPYCTALRQETEDNELIELAKQIDRCTRRHWVARLEKSPPWEASVGPWRPWQRREAWHFLPSGGEDHCFQLHVAGVPVHEQSMADDIYEYAVKPIKHPPARPPP